MNTYDAMGILKCFPTKTMTFGTAKDVQKNKIYFGVTVAEPHSVKCL